MFSNQQRNSIKSYNTEINMLDDSDKVDQFDDYFSYNDLMDCFDTEDPYFAPNSSDLEVQHNSVPLSSDPILDERRNSLLSIMNSKRNSLYGISNVTFEVPSDTPLEDCQECFAQFSSDAICEPTSAPSFYEYPERATVPDHLESHESGIDTSSDEFKQTFRKTLLNLEQSMKRSEASRLMLGEQRKAITRANNNAFNGLYLKGRTSQILSYMTQLGSNTL